MAQRKKVRTLLLCSTAMLCMPVFLPLSQTHAQSGFEPDSHINAYKLRRIKARAESYAQRKQFPPSDASGSTPPEMVENKHHEPLRVTIPNIERHFAEISGTRPPDIQLQEVHEEPLPWVKPEALVVAGSTEDVIPAPLPWAGSEMVSVTEVVETVQPLAPVPDEDTVAQAEAAYGQPAPGAQEPGSVQPSPLDMALNQPVNAESPALELAQSPMPPKLPAIAPEKTIYRSPGIIIKREIVRAPIPADVLASASPEQLAALSPSAGSPYAALNEPLIPIPASDVPAGSPPAMAPLVPATEPQPQPDASPTQVAPPMLNPANSGDLHVEQAIGITPQKDLTSPPAALPPLDETPIPNTGEPSEALSRQSERILKSLPRLADEKPREPQGADIDRVRSAGSLLDAEVAPVSHEAAGVKIEIKAPSMNINHELEKAYNALISGYSSIAMDIYNNVLASQPGNVDALFGLATTYHRAGQIDAARPLYGKILARDPSHQGALNNFLVLVADEAPEAALAQLEAMERKSPDFSPIPAQMAVIYQRSGNLEKASEKMFKAVMLAPENMTYRYNLAILLDKQRNYTEAARLYTQLLQAHARGEIIPGDATKIQERLTFLRSNKE